MKTKIFGKAVMLYGDKILVLRRSKDDDYMPGELDLPGGKIDSHEELEDGLLRELREEIGHVFAKENLDLVYTFTSIKEDANYVRLYFIGELATNNITLSDEHSEVLWMDLDEAIRANNHPTQKTFLKYVKTNQLLARPSSVTLQ